eukprot:SAG11_NODE_469_length_9207_cov_5.391744_3_plen_336_part_00
MVCYAAGRDHYLTQRYKRATKFEKEQYDAIVQSNGLENWTNPFFLDEPKRVPALLKQCIEITKADKTFNEEQQKEISSRISRDMDCEQLSDGDDDDDEEEEEEEEEVYMVHEHNSNLLTESFYMMGVGTVLVLLFSDPMVDCLGDLATRTGIPTFYVSFLLAPLASNASELLSSMKMAEKKDEESITAAMQQCLGACIMNNTLGLFTFMALIYFQGLEWEYSSETVCTVIPQLAIVPFTYLSVHNMTAAYMVASLYPVRLLATLPVSFGSPPRVPASDLCLNRVACLPATVDLPHLVHGFRIRPGLELSFMLAGRRGANPISKKKKKKSWRIRMS